MSDFLSRLADRSQGRARLARPRQRSRFEHPAPSPLSESAASGLPPTTAEEEIPAAPSTGELPAPVPAGRADTDPPRRKGRALTPAPTSEPKALVPEVAAPGRRGTPHRQADRGEASVAAAAAPWEAGSARPETPRRPPTAPDSGPAPRRPEGPPASAAEGASPRAEAAPPAPPRARPEGQVAAEPPSRRRSQAPEGAADPGPGLVTPASAAPSRRAGPLGDRVGKRRPAGAESEPVVKVKIGRVDVRAVAPPSPPVRDRRPSGPKLTLGDYLRARNERRR